MLIRSPIQRDRPYRQANNAAAWNGHTLPADASDVDEAIDDEMEAAEDYSAEGDYEDEAERYDQTEEDERYEEEPGWGEQQDGQQWDDDQQQQGWDEEQEEYEWHEGEEEDASAESRALVPLNAPRVTRRLFSFSRNIGDEDDEAALIPYREPGLTTPIFIGGTRQTLQSGKLGHSPLSLVARRRRPFYMHTLAIGVGLLSLLATVVALVPLGVGSHILQSLNSLANSAAPAANTIPFRPYIVHYGETLAMIADKFHVAQGGILEINNLESADQLYLGQRIKVPTNPTYGANYHALLNIPLAPLTTPSPPYGTFVIPPGFDSFAVQDYNGDPWGGSFGQCTWWAHHKRPDENLAGMGDAWAWLYAAPQRGLTVTAKPLLNATVIFEPGVEAASGIGHVAHVEQILPGGWVLISEMNFFWNGGGWGRVDYRYIQPGPGVWFIA